MERTMFDERGLEKLKAIFELQTKHGLVNESFKQKLDAAEHFHAVVPIVGKFSTGKSSLLNALLGQNYLRTKLTPATSIPTEIIFDRTEGATIFRRDEISSISIDEFTRSVYCANEVKKIRLSLNNEFLSSIPTVMLTDMPGFDSGIEVHNRALDDYLPYSHAYILIFASNESYIPESMIEFLSELRLHDVPVFIVITKSQSVSESRLRECVESIRECSVKYLGLSNIEIACTNAKGKENVVDPLKKILRQVESAAQKIFEDEAKKLLLIEAERLRQYLQTVISRIDFTPYELEVQRDECRRQLERLKEKLERARQNFSEQVAVSIENIKAQVSDAMYNTAPVFETMLLNRTDIGEKINLMVRQAVVRSCKKDFEPKLRRYVEKMAHIIHVDLNVDTELKLDETQLMMDNAAKEAIKKAIPMILSLLGAVLSGSLAALAGLFAGLLVELGFMQNRQDEKRRLAREKVYNKIIPNVVNCTGEAVTSAIGEVLDKVNRAINDEAQRQIELREKALAEIIKSLEIETETRNQRLRELRAELETVNKLIEE